MKSGNNSSLGTRSWVVWLDTLAKIAGILTLFAAILALTLIFFETRKIREGVQQLQQATASNQFAIISPKTGDIVDPSLVLIGRTPHPEMNHFLVATPVKSRTGVVQDGPVQVSANGVWFGIAQLGSTAVGEGESFMISCVATTTRLSSGPLPPNGIPKDAVFSEPVIVTRKK